MPRGDSGAAEPADGASLGPEADAQELDEDALLRSYLPASFGRQRLGVAPLLQSTLLPSQA